MLADSYKMSQDHRQKFFYPIVMLVGSILPGSILRKMC